MSKLRWRCRIQDRLDIKASVRSSHHGHGQMRKALCMTVSEIRYAPLRKDTLPSFIRRQNLFLCLMQGISDIYHISTYSSLSPDLIPLYAYMLTGTLVIAIHVMLLEWLSDIWSRSRHSLIKSLFPTYYFNGCLGHLHFLVPFPSWFVWMFYVFLLLQ